MQQPIPIVIQHPIQRKRQSEEAAAWMERRAGKQHVHA